MELVHKYIEDNIDKALQDLGILCSFQSVAVKGKYMAETAEYVKHLLDSAGFNTKLLFVDGANPVVFGELKGQSDRTLLFYNHYDVQPADEPGWLSDPFKVIEKDGYVYGRGVSDNKGNIIARILAVKAYKDVFGTLPITIKFFIEGDEEIGSPKIKDIIERYHELLTADAIIWEGGSKDHEGYPRIYYGTKGTCYLELEATCTGKVLHSSMASVIPNPAVDLVRALASMQKDTGEIAIKGFYDDLYEPGKEEILAAEALSEIGNDFKENYKINKFARNIAPEKVSYDLFFTPFFVINGINSGYTGTGMKQIMPDKATAKIEFMLIPAQDAEDILRKVKKHLEDNGYSNIKTNKLGALNPQLTPMSHPFVKLTQNVAKEVYEVDPVLYPT
ncbi:MAG: M20/M25/M40 family metallo-hydrolase, partial [Clostridiales bacterium]|nr:M20/M25/M40 family metallo-hydrolase [Clostridiales bacterium]